jgi:hypothetical protein
MRDFEEEWQEDLSEEWQDHIDEEYPIWLERKLTDSRAAHKATLRSYAKLNREHNSLVAHLRVMVELTDMALNGVEQ